MPRKANDNGIETKKAILASAKRLIARRGYENTSLSDIAKYASVTRGAVYWHFENKEELLIALLDSLEEDFPSCKYIKAASNPKEENPLLMLKNWVLYMVDDLDVEFLSSRFVAEFMKIVHGSVRNKELQERLKKRIENRNNFTILALKNAVDKGQLPQNLDIDAASQHLIMFFIGFLHQSRDNKVDKIKQDYAKYVDWEFNLLERITKDKDSSN